MLVSLGPTKMHILPAQLSWQQISLYFHFFSFNLKNTKILAATVYFLGNRWVVFVEEVGRIAGTFEYYHTVVIFGHILAHSFLPLLKLHQLIELFSVGSAALHFQPKGSQFFLKLAKRCIVIAQHYFFNIFRRNVAGCSSQTRSVIA